MKLIRLTLFPLTIFFLFSSCARNPVTGKRDFMLMSESQEIAMGKQSDPEIKSFFGTYDDQKLQQFIQQKGEAMAAISHRPDLPYEFKIVDSPVVNAFAVPGGYIYFTRGIMAHFNNEAEFAGVLGHEIGHVTARHSAKQYSKAMLAQVGMVAGMVLSPEFRQFADLANTGVSMLFLKFGRDAENQADRLGVEYSTKIDYDAQEMAGFFQTLQRLQAQSGGEAVPTFMSTHPHPSDRFNNVTKLAKKWQKKLNKNNLETDRNGYLKMIDGIVYGDDPRQGFVENNIFYHPVLKFQFPTPQGWAFQNTPVQVQMANKEGNAAMVFRLAPGKSLREAAQQTLSSNNLTAVESKEVSVNGYSALAVVADQQPQQQQMQQQQQQQAPPIRVLAYFIQDGQNIYNFLGYSAQPDFQQHYSTFNSVINNFRKLTDQTKLNRKPDRVRVKTVDQNGTLKQAFQKLKVPAGQMNELALLNGMELNENVQQGTLIKVIENGKPTLIAR